MKHYLPVLILTLTLSTELQAQYDFVIDISSPKYYFETGYKAFQKGNYDEAISCFATAYEKGNTDAIYWIGVCYDSGLGVAQNTKCALKFYNEAANRGQVDACFALGCLYYTGFESEDTVIQQDINRSMEWLRLAANNNHSNAQCLLGDCYYLQGDAETAFSWYNKSASLNNPTGIQRVGVRLMDGDGTTKNLPLAIQYLNTAKSMGVADSDFILGKAYYFHGDYLLAIKCFLKTVEDDAESARWLGSCYAAKEPAEYDMALYYWEKSAEKGDLYGKFYTALCYYDGMGCEKSFKKAVRYLTEIIPPGGQIDVKKEYRIIYGVSARLLANCARYGRGIDVDIEFSNSLANIAKQLGCENITIRDVIDNIKRDKNQDRQNSGDIFTGHGGISSITNIETSDNQEVYNGNNLQSENNENGKNNFVSLNKHNVRFFVKDAVTKEPLIAATVFKNPKYNSSWLSSNWDNWGDAQRISYDDATMTDLEGLTTVWHNCSVKDEFLCSYAGYKYKTIKFQHIDDSNSAYTLYTIELERYLNDEDIPLRIVIGGMGIGNRNNVTIENLRTNENFVMSQKTNENRKHTKVRIGDKLKFTTRGHRTVLVEFKYHIPDELKIAPIKGNKHDIQYVTF